MLKKNLILLIFFFLPGIQFNSTCIALEIKHPPSYEDIKKLSPKSNIEYLRALQKALQFTPSELELIREKGNTKQLIGAGTQAESDYQLGIDLLRMAVKKNPDNPVALAALVYKELGSLERHGSTSIKPRSIEQSIAGLRTADPDNALSAYLEAYLYVLLNKFDDASKMLIRADDKQHLETYELEIRKCVIEAAEYLDYPPLVARSYPTIIFIGAGDFVSLARQILNQNNVKKEVAQSCVLLGKRLEDKAKWTIQLMLSYTIQGMAFSKLANQTAKKELKELQQKDQRLQEKRRIYKNDNLPILSEAELLILYNILYEYGEEEAAKKRHIFYTKNYFLLLLFQTNF